MFQGADGPMAGRTRFILPLPGTRRPANPTDRDSGGGCAARLQMLASIAFDRLARAASASAAGHERRLHRINRNTQARDGSDSSLCGLGRMR